MAADKSYPPIDFPAFVTHWFCWNPASRPWAPVFSGTCGFWVEFSPTAGVIGGVKRSADPGEMAFFNQVKFDPEVNFEAFFDRLDW